MKRSSVILFFLLCLVLLPPICARADSVSKKSAWGRTAWQRSQEMAVETAMFHQMILKERGPSAKYGNHWRFFLSLGGVWQLPLSRTGHHPIFVRVRETNPSRAILLQARDGLARRVEMGSAYPLKIGGDRLDQLNVVRLHWRDSHRVDVDTVDTLGGMSQSPDPIASFGEATYTLSRHKDRWKVTKEPYWLTLSF